MIFTFQVQRTGIYISQLLKNIISIFLHKFKVGIVNKSLIFFIERTLNELLQLCSKLDFNGGLIKQINSKNVLPESYLKYYFCLKIKTVGERKMK